MNMNNHKTFSSFSGFFLAVFILGVTSLLGILFFLELGWYRELRSDEYLLIIATVLLGLVVNGLIFFIFRKTNPAFGKGVLSASIIYIFFVSFFFYKLIA